MEGERFPVTVRYYGTESYADLAPMLDELESKFSSIDFTVARPDPKPRGGGPFPVALALTFDLNTLGAVISAGAAIYAGAFLAELGKQDAKALRQELLKIPVLGPGPRKDLSRTPLSIMVGTVQFYIDAPMTEKELAVALQQAAKLVESMPEGRVNNAQGISGWPITWDSSTRSWQVATG